MPQLDLVNERLLQAVERAQAFYATLANNPAALEALGLTAEQVENVVMRLDTARLSTERLGEFMGVSLGQIAQTATDGLVSAFDRFAQAVGEGRNVFRSVWSAFRQFAADFLRQITQMIQQQIIFYLVSGLLKAASGGGNVFGPNPSGGAIGMHAGGIVGQDRTFTRNVSPAWS